jgi:D-alanyl-D-alanine carboxypeptidase/D-alanyl-D-alanine-endopeptidase (penicillin-binding protein 4)
MAWDAVAPMSEPSRQPATDPAAGRTHRLRSIIVRTLVIALVVVAAAAAGIVVIARETTSSDDHATPSPTTPAPTGVSVAAPPEPQPGLGPAAGDGVTGSELRARLAPLLTNKRFGPSHLAYAYATLDGAKPLISSGVDDVVTPASTLKLLTTATALAQLGADARFETTVVRIPGTRQLVLVGGGDPLLTDVVRRTPQELDDYPRQASLADLARQTATVIAAGGVAEVSLSYDDSLFAGPEVSPRWKPTYVPESIVSPITPLWVNEGREKPGLAKRSIDPSLAAARRFAELLKARGVKVAGKIIARRAPAGARQLATASSAPLAALVEHTLELSDNEAAEVLLRQAAIASGRAGSFAAGVATVRATMRSLGVDLTGARIFDGSGLSRDDRLPVWSLIQVLQAAARSDRADLRAVLTTLPVAGFNGSLAYRFSDAPNGLGLVRAKTGTLTGVHGLAGLAVTRGGDAIVFATVADRVPVLRTLPVRAQLDRIAAALTSCC